MTTTIQEQLDSFREAYKSIRVLVRPDYLVYTVSRYNAGKGVEDANKLISLNKWDLVAIQTSLNTFCVQSSNTEY